MVSSRRWMPLATRHSNGFSLVELTVVLLIIGLIAGLVTINVRGIRTRSKQNAARIEIAEICKALELYYNTYDRYPSNDEGLEALSVARDSLAEPLLKRIPSDPWSRPYEYFSPGKKEPYEVVCFGADGREGGDGADTDIVSDDLKQ